MSHFLLWLMFAGCCELLPPGHLSVRVDLFPVLFVRSRDLCLFFLQSYPPEFLFLELKKGGKIKLKDLFQPSNHDRNLLKVFIPRENLYSPAMRFYFVTTDKSVDKVHLCDQSMKTTALFRKLYFAFQGGSKCIQLLSEILTCNLSNESYLKVLSQGHLS